MKRHTWRGFFYLARCHGCDWTQNGKTALGLAAQHHDRTGHSVYVDVEGHVSYLNDFDHKIQMASKSTGASEESGA